MMSKFKLTVFIALTGLILSGCGIRPGRLTPADGKKDHFPHTYPRDLPERAK